MIQEKEYVRFIVRAKEITKEALKFYGISSTDNLDITFVYGTKKLNGSMMASYNAANNSMAYYVSDDTNFDLDNEAGLSLFLFLVFHELRHYTQNEYLRNTYGEYMYNDVLAHQMSGVDESSNNILEDDANYCARILTENFLQMKNGGEYDNTDIIDVKDVLTSDIILNTIKNYYTNTNKS